MDGEVLVGDKSWARIGEAALSLHCGGFQHRRFGVGAYVARRLLRRGWLIFRV